MTGWSGGNIREERGGYSRLGDREDARRPPRVPHLGHWYVKSMATVVPALASGIVGAIATDSAAVAAVAATAVSGLVAPAVDAWFRNREINTDDQAAERAAAAELGAFGTSGAIGRSLVIIGQVFQLFEEVDNQAEHSKSTFESSRTALQHVMGGGTAIPAALRETYALNEGACNYVETLQSDIRQAFVALRKVQALLG